MTVRHSSVGSLHVRGPGMSYCIRGSPRDGVLDVFSALAVKWTEPLPSVVRGSVRSDGARGHVREGLFDRHSTID